MAGDGDLPADASPASPAATPVEATAATPVAAGSSGFGRPYAPADWPLPGDRWRWSVGKRLTADGCFHDRLLFPPARFPRSSIPGGRNYLRSRTAAEAFVRSEIPGGDVDEFWASFHWKIPCAGGGVPKGSDKKIPATVSPSSPHVNGHVSHSPPGPPRPPPDCGDCKVGNKMCHLRVQARKDLFPKMPCDICCTENSFCRDCSCILCGSIIDAGYGGYGFMRCQAIVKYEGEKFICGHAAHMDCAFRAYLAGTIGGNVGLDAEYYCRRCDSRTDLVSYLSDLLDSTKALNSRDDVEKIVSLSSCLLRGSQKLKAKDLQARLEKIVAKLRDGFSLEEIWRVEDNIQSLPAEACPVDKGMLLGVANGSCCPNSAVDMDDSESSGDDHSAAATNDLHELRYISSDSRTASLNLENSIDNALRELKKSQDLEYQLAEEKLYAQKDIILGFYQELEAGRKGLANPAGSASKAESESLMTDHLSRVARIQREEAKLKLMMSISRGFGRAGKAVLKEMYEMWQDG